MRGTGRAVTRAGLTEYLDAPAGSLPLGKQRIVEIARALAADPALILLDEPAAGLRLLEKQELAALLRQLRGEGMTVLLVEHDMDFVMGLTDRLVVMDFGEKLAEGVPADIQRDPAAVMLRETQTLRTLAGKAGDSDLEPMLQAAAAAWPGERPPVENLRYEAGKLTLSAVGWSDAQIEQFRSVLRPAGVRVDASEGRLVLSRLQGGSVG